MERSLLGTRRVISSIFTLNFFVTRIKQPMTIATNRMCISRNDNCVNTMCFPRQRSRQLQENSLRRFAFVAFLDKCDTSYPIGELPFNFLLCDEFLKTYYSVCHNFRGMCRSSRMKSFESCFKVEDQGTWHRQNLHGDVSCQNVIMIVYLSKSHFSGKVWGNGSFYER